MTVYFLSGLGADKRAFKYLTFPPNTTPVFIDWLIPFKKESLPEYAIRISEKINTEEPFMIVGLSFGGIIATEIIQFVKPIKTILISSVTKRQELPFFFRLAGALNLYVLFPASLTNRLNAFTAYIFGTKNEKDKQLLNEILTTTNTQFSKWAMSQILKWKRKQSPKNIIRIHGTNDRILPINNFVPDYIINGGGHFMIVNRAEEISRILDRELRE